MINSYSANTGRVFAYLIIFLSFGLFIHSTRTTYITADEYLVYKFTRDDLGQTFSYLANSDVHPPLWFSFFWGWHRLVGQSDFAGRVQAILFSVLTLSVVYRLGKRWFYKSHFGLVAMTCLVVSALFYHHALEIRPYALALLLTSLSMYAFQQWISQKTIQKGLVYGASVAILLYVHYFLLLFVLIQVIYFVISVRPIRSIWRQAIVVVGFTGLLFLPWFPSFLNQLQHIRAVELASGSVRGVAGSSATTQTTSIEEILKLVQIATNNSAWLYAVIVVLGTVYWWRKSNFRLALAWGIGVPALTFVVNLFVAVYTPRYIVNFVIGLALVLAAAIGHLPAKSRWVVVLVFVVVNLWTLPSVFPNDVIPYRDLLKELVVNFRPGDKIFINPPDSDSRGVQFNWEYSRQFTQEMYEGLVRTVDDALPYRRIWYLTGNWFNDDIRVIFNQLEETHPVQSVYGKCDRLWCYLVQLLEAPPLNTPLVFGDEMGFWGIDIDSVNRRIIQSRLWWKVEKAPLKDYSVSLQLRDKSGAVVSQLDRAINHYGVTTYNTTQLVSGEIYIDFRNLEVPTDLASGEYSLSLIVYDWQTMKRLLLADGSDHAELGIIHIP
jgi:hypothetical protein